MSQYGEQLIHRNQNFRRTLFAAGLRSELEAGSRSGQERGRAGNNKRFGLGDFRNQLEFKPTYRPVILVVRRLPQVIEVLRTICTN